MRLGLFGGSFDPVHLGHLQLAECCQQQAALDEVWFMPAATQPFKKSGPHATDEHRLAMLELATQAEPTWQVSRIELDRGGVSYTADTLRCVHQLRPDDELFFMLGADSLRDFPTWREPQEILRLATPLVVARAGEPAPDFRALLPVASEQRVAELQASMVDMPAMHMASSTIRERIASGDDVQSMLPAEVWQYIEQQQLYLLPN
ncbi:nicotinate-nucleotide adenylyltransferase [Aeoliella mucimassa]|uniref:Probable nicotinate-nucleotide adenylyltransferase n=1 Tax=Aeoliella mucimassa TaxID=2527972 RepID=A0A518AI67_9BACT|nr:nicotinate-nucleotide adenylyltransferase [Aeoliella mucimassa]QDU54423.1 Nicotinate-nucleotide adenylyltransferase [Aeoliella mucimassa]